MKVHVCFVALLTACAHTVRPHPNPDFRVLSANRYGCALFAEQAMTLADPPSWSCEVVGRDRLPTILTIGDEPLPGDAKTVLMPLAIQRPATSGSHPWQALRGAYCPLTGTIAISISDARLDTLEHELGHRAGLDHSHGGVMDPDR